MLIWIAIMAFVFLGAFFIFKPSVETWCCEHGIAISGWCDECQNNHSDAGEEKDK